jgi:gamma-glutamyl hercynylcysteine S-oxide synthase
MRNPHNTQCWLMVVFLAVAAFAKSGAAQDTKYVPGGAWEQMMIAPPDCLSPKDEWEPRDGERSCVAHEDWLNDITRWRAERRIRIGYDGSRYEISSLQWTQSSFIQTQMMVEDRYFYDPVAGKYTVDLYLGDLQSRYGGIDAVLIWPTYPNLGIDDRNQLDMIRSMPGGIAGVKQMVADFHRRGFVCFSP